ncbi:MAG: DUF4135 domain-containing protein, partial [Mycobacterium sp.]
MAALDERLLARALTIDELLSGASDQLPGQKGDSDLAARRVATWCRSCASGNWSLFVRRLERDGLSIEDVLAKFATVRRNASWPTPTWLDDAVWVNEALRSSVDIAAEHPAPGTGPCAFEDLLKPVVREAETRLWSAIDSRVGAAVSDSARACLRRSLLAELSSLSAGAIYERFAKVRQDTGPSGPRGPSNAQYHRFVADMKANGWRQLFEDKPVLLRLMASLTRQWIDASKELITRLDADLPAIRRDLLETATSCQVTSIDSDLSDRHNFGRTVAIIGFQDGSRIVYKPKDLGVDAGWH